MSMLDGKPSMLRPVPAAPKDAEATLIAMLSEKCTRLEAECEHECEEKETERQARMQAEMALTTAQATATSERARADAQTRLLEAERRRAEEAERRIKESEAECERLRSQLIGEVDKRANLEGQIAGMREATVPAPAIPVPPQSGTIKYNVRRNEMGDIVGIDAIKET